MKTAFAQLLALRLGRCSVVLPLALTCVYPSPSAAQVLVAGKPYQKLATRQATREAMLSRVSGTTAAFGPWMMLAPLDHPSGAKDIAAEYPPEAMLDRMRPGGTGPDFAVDYPRKGGGRVAWREVAETPDIGGIGGPRPLDFREGVPQNLWNNAVGYLYRTITTDANGKGMDLPVMAGSDDGLRLWLNGELLVDENVERPLDPQANRVVLKLRPGTNHLFAKVSQGAGEWEFQMTPELAIDPALEAALDWQLDEDFPDAESRYYRIATIPTPTELVGAMEVGGVMVLPDGRPAVATRRGDIWFVGGAYDTPALATEWAHFADGLQEPLGLSARAIEGGAGSPRVELFTAQRSELTALSDENGDGRADGFRTICDGWTISGNYHEYAFGPKFDRAGNAWITLNLAHTGGETVMGTTVPTRGWAVKVPVAGPDAGKLIKVADGLRSPDGVGIGPDGEMFYTDNQGDYVATNKLCHLKPGAFYGHQASLRFRDGYGPNWRSEGKPVPEITWPAVWFPYKKMGQSASDILLDDTGGRFGPFAGQLFIGEQTYAEVFRVYLEKIGGGYQGACFPFKYGFASGVHRLCWSPPDKNQRASMFVGMTDRGWGSTGPKRDGLQRLIWTGKLPFEIREMRLKPDGFELAFTRELAPGADNPAKYAMSSYTYDYHPDYGSPEVETQELTVSAADLVDPRTIRLRVGPIRCGGMGFVHELSVTGVTCAPGDAGPAEPLLHDKAYYTVQRPAEK